MPELYLSRSIEIQAPVEKVFTVVGDFKQWIPWSPWILIEPECKLEFAEDGSSYSWDGNIIGSGSLTKKTSENNKHMLMDLQFFKPWKSRSAVTFDFKATGTGTEVRWDMRGSLPFFLFFMKKKMEAFVGMDYERGLKMLKEYCETGAINSKLNFNGTGTFAGTQAVAIRRRTTIDQLSEHMTSDMQTLRKFGEKHKLEGSDVPFSVYEKWDPVKREVIYVSGQPVASLTVDLEGELFSYQLPECKIYEVEHNGVFDHVGNAWSAAMMHVQAKKLKQHKKIMPFERYTRYAEDMPESEYQVKVCFPLRD